MVSTFGNIPNNESAVILTAYQDDRAYGKFRSGLVSIAARYVEQTLAGLLILFLFRERSANIVTSFHKHRERSIFHHHIKGRLFGLHWHCNYILDA